MACETRVNQNNIKIEPVYVSWERQQLVKITTIADVSSALNNDYFIISSPSVDYYVWFNVAAAGTDPAISGKTGIEVEFAANASAATIASAIVTAVEAETAFHAKLEAGCTTDVYIQNVVSGAALTAAGAGTSGMTVTTVRTGELLELGYLDGDIEPAFSEDILDVTTHQTGTQIVQGLRTGRNLEAISIGMKEASAAKLQEILKAGGAEYTPSNSGATDVVAWGSEDSKTFTAISGDCRKLVFHPVRLADNNKAEDMCFWLSYPMLEGIVFSGENTKTINVSFKILPDGVVAKPARLFVYGDHTQNFLA